MPRFRLARRLLNRLALAVHSLPPRHIWLEIALLSLAFLMLAAPIAQASGLLAPSSRPEAIPILVTGLRALLVPALLEETVFRVLANPHPQEAPGRSGAAISGALSLAAYVLVHALVGTILPDRAGHFTSPAFLLLTALLGSFCLFAYRRSGSLWPPVALHWLAVVGYLALGGHGPLS